MAYGEIKIDTITFTAGGSDTSISVSGLVQNPTFTGNITTTGTISGDVIRGQTVSGVTVTGGTAQFGNLISTTGTFVSLTGTVITGTTATYSTLSGVVITGATGRFTNITGVNLIGTTLVSGTTVTGNAAQFTTLTGGTAGFTTVTGTTVTGTTANFATLSGTTITGGHVTTASGTYTGNVTAAGFVPTGSTVPTNGVYLPSANNVAISTNSTGRLFVDSSGRLGVGTASPGFLVTAATSADGVDGISVESPSSNGVIRLRADGTNGNAIRVGGIGAQGNTLRFLVGGDTERMRLDSSGRLGLGTSSPGTILDIRQTQTGSETKVSVFNTDNGNTTTQTAIIGLSPDSRAAATAGIEAIKETADFSTSAARDVALALNTTLNNAKKQAVYITSAGNVGIGTTSPQVNLHINQSDSGSNYLQFTNSTTGSTSNDGGLVGINANEEVVLWNYENNPIKFGVNGGEVARIDSSGRLLVGTSTARGNFFNSSGQETNFQIEGTGYAGSSAAFVRNSNTSGASYLILGKTRGTAVGANTIVNASDDLGVISFQGSDGSELVQAAEIKAVVDGTPGANDMPGNLVFSTTADGASSPTERMTITSAGVVRALGVYNETTSNAANMNVSSLGTIQRSTSSIKYKTQVEDLDESYADALLECRPVWYRSTCAADDPTHSYWGFIAEEIAEIDPRLVHWKTTEPVVQENGSIEHIFCEPEPEGVAYDRFVPHLLNLIKRQKEQIEAIEARLSALEGA